MPAVPVSSDDTCGLQTPNPNLNESSTSDKTLGKKSREEKKVPGDIVPIQSAQHKKTSLIKPGPTPAVLARPVFQICESTAATASAVTNNTAVLVGTPNEPANLGDRSTSTPAKLQRKKERERHRRSVLKERIDTLRRILMPYLPNGVNTERAFILAEAAKLLTALLKQNAELKTFHARHFSSTHLKTEAGVKETVAKTPTATNVVGMLSIDSASSGTTLAITRGTTPTPTSHMRKPTTWATKLLDTTETRTTTAMTSMNIAPTVHTSPEATTSEEKKKVEEEVIAAVGASSRVACNHAKAAVAAKLAITVGSAATSATTLQQKKVVEEAGKEEKKGTYVGAADNVQAFMMETQLGKAESHHNSMFVNKKRFQTQQDTVNTTTTLNPTYNSVSTLACTAAILPLTSLSANSMEYHHDQQCDDNTTAISNNDQMGVSQQWLRRQLHQQQGIVTKMTAEIRRLESENAQNKEVIKELSYQRKRAIFGKRSSTYATRETDAHPDGTASGDSKERKGMEISTITDRMEEYREGNAVESPTVCNRSVFNGTKTSISSKGNNAQHVSSAAAVTSFIMSTSPSHESGHRSSRTSKRRRGRTKSVDGGGDVDGECKDGKAKTGISSSKKNGGGEAKNLPDITTVRRRGRKFAKLNEGQSTGRITPSAAAVLRKNDDYDEDKYDMVLMKKRQHSQQPLRQDKEFNSLYLLLDAAGKKNNNSINRHET
uniref:BHLH domain-containing protein n=1 Tax=Bigelowiella natans TaxID=227086 RepID=A0A7S2P6R9_BIGNA